MFPQAADDRRRAAQSGLNETFEIASQHVDLNDNSRPRAYSPITVTVLRMRNDVDSRTRRRADRIDREAHAVDGDRAFRRNVARQRCGNLRRRCRFEPPTCSTPMTSPTPSTWPVTMWPSSGSPALSGGSRIHARSPRSPAERRDGQGRGGYIGGEAARRDSHGRQADAVDGDAAADGERPDCGAAELDCEAHVASGLRARRNPPDAFHQSREHVLYLRSLFRAAS